VQKLEPVKSQVCRQQRVERLFAHLGDELHVVGLLLADHDLVPQVEVNPHVVVAEIRTDIVHRTREEAAQNHERRNQP